MNNLHGITRHAIVAASYALLAALSLAAGYLLRFDFAPPAEMVCQMFHEMFLSIGIKLVVLYFGGQFGSLLSFFSIPDLRRISVAGLSAGTILFGLWMISGGQFAPPRSVIVMDALTFVGLVCGLRLFLRNLREQSESPSATKNRHLESVAIVGAGDAGARLAQQLMGNSGFGMQPVVFLDDDRRKWGQFLHGVPVVGDPSWLLGKTAPSALRRVIIAMPSAPRKRVRAIIEMLEGKGYRLETTPSLAEMTESKTSLARLRPIQIDDLLGRAAAQLDSEGIRQMLAGRVVAVTGAGGSIGSELCRQILRYQPERLLLI